jgi:hypothetical protein
MALSLATHAHASTFVDHGCVAATQKKTLLRTATDLTCIMLLTALSLATHVQAFLFTF